MTLDVRAQMTKCGKGQVVDRFGGVQSQEQQRSEAKDAPGAERGYLCIQVPHDGIHNKAQFATRDEVSLCQILKSSNFTRQLGQGLFRLNPLNLC